MLPSGARLAIKGLVVLQVLILAGCTTFRSADLENRTRVFPKDYGTTIRSALSYLQQMGWRIERDDRQIGIIETDYLSIPDLDLVMGQTKRYKVTLVFTKIPIDQTKIVAEVKVADVRGTLFDGTVLVYDRRGSEVYDEIFSAIEKALGLPR